MANGKVDVTDSEVARFKIERAAEKEALDKVQMIALELGNKVAANIRLLAALRSLQNRYA